VTLSGNEIEDTITVGFGNDLYTSFRSVFIGVDGTVNSKFASKTDGFMGLAPYAANLEEKDRNFLY
jgi:hypothetical protein